MYICRSLSAQTGLPQAAVPQQASGELPAGVSVEVDAAVEAEVAASLAALVEAFAAGDGAVSVFFGRSILNESSAHAALPISIQTAMRNTTMTEVARIKRFCN